MFGSPGRGYFLGNFDCPTEKLLEEIPNWSKKWSSSLAISNNQRRHNRIAYNTGAKLAHRLTNVHTNTDALAHTHTIEANLSP